MKRSQFLVLLFTLMIAAVAALPAFALELKDAREQGLVGEKRTGYVAAIENKAGVDALVKEVNARRREEYAKISASNGQPVDVVAKVAAQQIIGSLQPGSYFEGNDGKWHTR